MGVEQLARGHERAWRQVYRWSAIARRLARARNFSPLALSANLGYRFYAHHLQRFYNCDWPLEAVLPSPLPLPRLEPAAAAADETAGSKRAVCG
jgi:hypothetical protein